MASTNIIDSAVLYGKTVPFLTAGASAQTVLINAAASNAVHKINSIIITNSTAALINVKFSFVRGGTSYDFAGNTSLEANTTMFILTRESGFYLEEGDSVTVTASAAGVSGILSYDLIV